MSDESRDWRADLGLVNGASVSFEAIANVPERELQPLWPGILWLGKPTLLVGDPGLGKSQLALAIAATVSSGGTWPCSSDKAEVGDVLLVSAEDDAGDTIKPRLIAAGANLDRVHVVTATHLVDDDGERTESLLTLTDHGSALVAAMRRMSNPRLLIVDPFSAFMSGTDSHNNAEVRAALSTLAKAAQELMVAVLLIGHLNKGAGGKAMYRAAGSLAFVAAARAAYLVERDPDDQAFRLMLPIKNNLAKDTCGFRFSIAEADNGAPYVRWADQAVVEGADELLARIAVPREAATDSRVREVCDWLKAELADGLPHSAAQLWEESEGKGFSKRAVKQACVSLGLHKRQIGFRGAWHWQLPHGGTT